MRPTLIETPRLRLCELTEDDLGFLAAMLGDPEVMRFYPGPLDADGVDEWLGRQFGRYDEHGIGLWLAVEKATGVPVGQVGLIPPRGIPGAEEVELGYLIHRPYWRRGFAAEAAAACRDYAFETLDRPRVLALIRPENTASLAVARSVGLTPTGLRAELAELDHLVLAADRPGRAVW